MTTSANDGSVCSRITWGIDWAWQCTPVLVATGAGSQSVATGGSASWSGSFTCEWRKKGDGFNSNWGPWTSCSLSASGPTSCSWGTLQSSCGGSRQFAGNQIINVDTWGMTDCVEIRTSLNVSGTARTTLNLLSASSSVRFPSSGTNVSGICEGGSAY